MSTNESRKPVDPKAPSQRFLFETSFDTEALDAEEEAVEPTFSVEELDAARQAAYAEGDAAGRQDVINGIEKQLLNGLGRLVEQIGALSEDQTRYQDGLTARSVELALKALRKMFPALAEREGLVEIEAVLAECLQEARTEPRIAIRVAGRLAEPLQERVAALSAAAGHEGSIAVLADDTLGDSDCRVEWAQGGAERVVQNMWQEFEAAAQRIFQAAGADDAGQAPDAGDEDPTPATAAEDPAASEPDAPAGFEDPAPPTTDEEPAASELDAPAEDAPVDAHANGATVDALDQVSEPDGIAAPDPVPDAAGDFDAIGGAAGDPDPAPQPSATAELPDPLPQETPSQDTPNAS